ncbi:hypothetical protein [uncultured Nitratireductor sp.]|uniref:hypothetical protein n=1 Tax=uncultured Nitratireductor sp. TaxID=520953 RepID=UPI0025DA7CEF|nr:hypothetical protein [uncultured Nitratireductor sp.]
MTCAKRTKAARRKFDGDIDDIFAVGPSADGRFADIDPIDEWDDLPGEPSDAVAHDLLLSAIEEDPFSTSRLDDCAPFMGLTPSALARFERASAAYVAACRSHDEPDDDREEILRLIAAYWLKKCRPCWLD